MFPTSHFLLFFLLFTFSCSENNLDYAAYQCDSPIFGEWHSINSFFRAKINFEELILYSDTCQSDFKVECPAYDPIWPVVGKISVNDLSKESSSCFQSIVKSCSYRLIDSNQFILNCENQEIELFRF